MSSLVRALTPVVVSMSVYITAASAVNIFSPKGGFRFVIVGEVLLSLLRRMGLGVMVFIIKSSHVLNKEVKLLMQPTTGQNFSGLVNFWSFIENGSAVLCFKASGEFFLICLVKVASY